MSEREYVLTPEAALEFLAERVRVARRATRRTSTTGRNRPGGTTGRHADFGPGELDLVARGTGAPPYLPETDR